MPDSKKPLAETVSLRSVKIDDDEPFLVKLFMALNSENEAWNLIEVSQRKMLIEMQYRAQKRQYSQQFPEAEHFIIGFEHKSIGRIMVNEGDRDLTCIDITLLEKFRNFGIGTFLLEKLVRKCKKSGRVLSLHVEKTNTAARLYERLGLKIVQDEGIYWKMELDPNFPS